MEKHGYVVGKWLAVRVSILFSPVNDFEKVEHESRTFSYLGPLFMSIYIECVYCNNKRCVNAKADETEF